MRNTQPTRRKFEIEPAVNNRYFGSATTSNLKKTELLSKLFFFLDNMAFRLYLDDTFLNSCVIDEL